MIGHERWILLGFDPRTDELRESFALPTVTTEEARKVLGLPSRQTMYDTYPVGSPAVRLWVEHTAGTRLSPELEYFVEQQELNEK